MEWLFLSLGGYVVAMVVLLLLWDQFSKGARLKDPYCYQDFQRANRDAFLRDIQNKVQ